MLNLLTWVGNIPYNNRNTLHMGPLIFITEPGILLSYASYFTEVI